MLTYHLLNAERGFKHRIEVLSNLNNMVKLVKKFYGKDIEHLISNDSYEEQKTVLMTIFNIFCDSMRNILRQTVQFNALDSIIQNAILTTKLIDNRKLFQGFKFYDFEAKAVKQKIKMRKFMVEQLARLLERYELYSTKIKERIDSLQGLNRDLKAEDFQGLLHSREEFWQELNRGNLLCSEEKYIVVDKKNADSIFLDKNYYENKICEPKQLACKDFPKYRNPTGSGSKDTSENKVSLRDEYPTSDHNLKAISFQEYSKFIARFRSILNISIAVIILLPRAVLF